jgi:hypothetical protein
MTWSRHPRIMKVMTVSLPCQGTFRLARRNRSMGTEIDTVTKALRLVAALAQDGLSDVH